MAYKNVDEYIAAQNEKWRKILQELRGIILGSDKKVTECIKWSQPVFEYNGWMCYIAAFNDHVNLGFYDAGKMSDESQSILQGTGKGLRHMKLYSRKDLDGIFIKKLLKDAIAVKKRSSKSKKDDKNVFRKM